MRRAIVNGQQKGVGLDEVGGVLDHDVLLDKVVDYIRPADRSFVVTFSR